MKLTHCFFFAAAPGHCELHYDKGIDDGVESEDQNSAVARSNLRSGVS